MCEAVSVQGEEFGGESGGRSVPRTGGGIPWVKVKRGAHIPEGSERILEGVTVKVWAWSGL